MVNPLARVVMNNIAKKVDNLTPKEEELIVDVIKGEKEVRKEDLTATMITLDEAVERIKGSR